VSTLAAPPGLALAAPTPPAAVRHLVGPVTDFLCVGGLSILLLAGVHLAYPLAPPERASYVIGWTFFYLTFVVNWPHFFISYQLLYWNYRHELLRRPRFVWAGVLAPALLGGLLVAVAATGSGWLAGWMVRAMFLLVGWHYVKQAYGCFVVLSARSRFFLTDGERRVARGAMYALWMLNFLGTNIGVQLGEMRGVTYSLFWQWPRALVPAAYAAMAVSALALVAMLVRKAWREWVTPPLGALVALLSIYAWFIPALNHPLFFHMVPLLHSLQYLLFAVLLTRNRAVAQAEAEGTSPWPRLVTYLGTTVLLGLVVAEIAPAALDRFAPLGLDAVTPTFWMFAVVWFVNVHHYFIDNKLWLRDNSEMRYLR
jgi:hypothetical protein